MANVEYLAVQKDANNFFERGYDIKYVYDELLNKELISMSYQSFCKYVKKSEKQSKPQKLLIAQTKLNNFSEGLKKEKEKNTKAKIHFFLQGQGGVGKSLVASFLYQYLKETGLKVVGLDCYSGTQGFSSYKEFNIKKINIIKNGEIKPRLFDELIETAIKISDNTHLIIDSSASSFIALASYLKSNSALKILTDYGHQVFMHTIISGAQGLTETLNGLKTLATNFPQYPLIVWLNSFYGDIGLCNQTFFDTSLYEEYKEQFHSIIKIPNLKKDTFGKDVENLLIAKQSFQAGINSSLPVMERQRLKIYWNEFKKEMANVNFNNSKFLTEEMAR